MKASPQRACRPRLFFQNSQYKKNSNPQRRTARRENCFFGDLARVEVDRNVLHGLRRGGNILPVHHRPYRAFREDGGLPPTMSTLVTFPPALTDAFRRNQAADLSMPQEFGILRFYRYKYPAIRL